MIGAVTSAPKLSPSVSGYHGASSRFSSGSPLQLLSFSSQISS
jgi:hypothetical protein